MPDVSSIPATNPTPNSAPRELEIHVIPDKYYGAALKAKIPEAGQQASNGLDQPPSHSPGLILVLVIAFVLLATGGAAAYLFRDSLFPKPKAPVQQVQQPPEQPPITAPEPPGQLAVTSTNPQSANLTWVDYSNTESGFRIDRAEGTADFSELTGLPPNSLSYVDVSVLPSKTYRYRVIARNAGGDSAPSSEAVVTVQSPPPAAPPAPKLPPAGLDTDSDGLTDLEEAMLNSDPKNPDTDSDGFLDGNEAFHLYNPNGRAPARLLDAKLVKQVDAPIGWVFQLPNAWNVELTSPDGSKATIKTIGKETFKLTVEENPKQLSMLNWYLSRNPEVKPEQVLKYKTKRGYEGIIGADLLTRYLPWGDRIFVLSYDLAGEPFINYQTLFSLMMNSLELRGLPQVSPAIVSSSPLPFEPAATTTGVITQPEAVTSTESSGAATSTTLTP